MTTDVSTILERRNQVPVKLFGALASVLLAVVVTGFFAHTRWPRGDDYRFHISVWAETASRIHHLDLPRWNAAQAFGLGEPTYLFYPPLPVYLGGLLTLLCGSYWAAPIFCGLVMVAAALSMRLCASLWLEPSRAWVVALLYGANPYLLLCFWVRSSYAETLAAILFPLLIYFTTVESSRYRIVACAFIFALIWLSNLPSAVIASYAIAIYIAVNYLADRNSRRALQSVIGLCLGFAIAAFQVLPSKMEMHLVQTEFTVQGVFDLPNYFVLGARAGRVRTMVFVFFMCLFLAGLARFYKQRASWPILALGLVSVLMLFRFSGVLWKIFPFLANAQFPYRWLFIFAFVSLLVGAHLIPAYSHSRFGVWLIAGALLVALAQSFAIAHMITTAKQLRDRLESTDAADTPLVVHEYLPKEVNADLIESLATDPVLARADVPAAVISIRKWDPEMREFSITTDQPAHVTLRLLNYMGWVATANGQPRAIITESGTGRAMLAIDPGSTLVQLRFSRSPDRTAGLIITLLALALCAAIVFQLRKAAPDKPGSIFSLLSSLALSR
jgi:uncharacterized membrane protein